MNSIVDTLASIATLISSIVAMISVIYLNKTLKEMKMQRKMAYRPQISIEPITYYLNYSQKKSRYLLQDKEGVIGSVNFEYERYENENKFVWE